MGSTDTGNDLQGARYHDDPPCIVGMACRLPGNISSPSELWEFLMRKACAQGSIPAQRFNKDGFYHPDGGSSTRAGLMDIAGGYFLDEDVRAFDNSLFGIHNLEAASMDPQQRKLLEIVFECLEHSGTSMDRVSGTNTGVFVGNFTLDHQTMQSRDIDAIHRFSATGCGTTILANRISHVFNLQGPSFTLDTACSSSLYALHSAVTALMTGDCDAAVVAAVNLIMSPEQCLAASKSGVLSSTSTCHTFDVTADGYGRAEGMNAMYLKRLSSALRDGDKIWAVVRGTAVNANGKTPGITQPSAALQEAVIRKAYQKAGLEFSETDYVECHGTGTPVGDPIEVDALGRCFASSERPSPLLIGSSKSSLGHSEAASGLTALIKVAMALEYAKIPPTYGVQTLNPKLGLESFNMKVAIDVEEWPRDLRRASVNAFGYGGANSHAILESVSSYLKLEKQRTREFVPKTVHEKILVLPVSAASPRSLATRIRQIRQMAVAGNTDTLESLVYTIAERVSHLSARGVVFAKANASDQKPELLDIDRDSGISQNIGPPLPVAFIFTGQGAQYATMGKGLLLQSKCFLTTIRQLDRNLQTLLPPEITPNWTLEDAILDPPETSQLHQAIRSQPVSTAIQIALVDLLRTWNVKPRAVVGHSSGEIAAAYAAGLLSAAQAILTAYLRGYAVSQLTIEGAMLAVGIDDNAANDLIWKAGLRGEVSVACINSPESTTLSGSANGIANLMEEIQRQKKFARKLRTGGRAYHSVMMREVGALYETLLAPYLDVKDGYDVQNGVSGAEMYSSVQTDGENEALVLGKDCVSASYWRTNLEKPVQFSLALRTLVGRQRKVHMIEIGPNPALKGPIQQILFHLKHDQRSVPYSCTLIRGQNADLCMKQLAGLLFICNQNLSWKYVNALTNFTLATNLPPYPWDYSAGLLWQEPRASVELRNRRHPRHELLGSQQVGGDGINWSWRNIITLNEIPWVRDHKLESQIVFPASCYLAMAIEAVSQATMSSGPARSFEFRHVNISTALVMPDDEAREGVEVHTTVSPRRLSRTTVSVDWQEFSISSFVAGQATLHCSGSIRASDVSSCMRLAETVTVENANDLEERPNMSIWYERFTGEGLCFGPNFQSVTRLRTDGCRSRCEATGTTRLVPAVSDEVSCTRYAFHPITIDACIQVAIMGSGAGDLNETYVYLPVFIDRCRISTAASADRQALGLIQAVSSETSPSTRRMTSTLWSTTDAEMPLIHLQGVRMTQYKTRVGRRLSIPRQPSLRVHWKPDIRYLHADMAQHLDSYVSRFIEQLRGADIELADDERLAAIGALIDLAGHKNPRIRVLELGDDCRCRAKKLLELLGEETGFKRCNSWKSGRLRESGVIQLEGEGGGDESNLDGPFDLIFVHKPQQIWNSVEILQTMLANHGVVVARNTAVAVEALRQGCFDVIELPNSKVILASSHQVGERIADYDYMEVLIVVHNPSTAVTAFAEALERSLHDDSNHISTRQVNLHEIEHTSLHWQTICASLVELEHTFLASMDQRDMDCLRSIINRTTTILWLSGANRLGTKSNPDLTLSNGFSRAMMLEQPRLDFIVMDVGSIINHIEMACQMVRRVLNSHYYKSTTEEDQKDKEFVLKDGLLYVSRFGPDFNINSLFRRRYEKHDAITKVKLSTAHPARLAIRTFGGVDSLHFEQVREPTVAIPNGFIDVFVKAVSLNAKDIYSLKGRVETRGATTALEFSGVVTAVGSEIENLRPGDDVFVGMPCEFATSQRVPVWAAHKLKPGEQYAAMATIPTIYGTALYALASRAHLRLGESILIHGGAGAFGFAAITIAKRILGSTANIYTTAGTEAKRAFITANLAVPESNIFNSRDASFAMDLKSATRGRGTDVVINFLTGDLLQASWECVAPFGRFVEIGKRDLIDAGRLDMSVFLRNATFTAFDFSDLYYQQLHHHDETFSSLLKEILDMYRSGQIILPPITVFPASEIVEAYRYFSSEDRIGKVVISFEEQEKKIALAPSLYLTLFDSQKVYLLVGCLGGLGRSLSRWMVARGARNFVFLGRSGCDKPSARQLVSRLEGSGVNVKVIRGDVTSRSDVDAAVSACTNTGKNIGGVVQAAMGLHEALFARMTSDNWQAVIQPKWKGTWNLHEALEGNDGHLDFFLMTSSLSGSIGTATESNYCAANSFVDAFAHWRLTQGKPAISVGLGMISEVGYLHEHPEIEALLLRKGIQPLNEAEFLQIVDLALAGVGEGLAAKNDDSLTPAHLLTGLEPLGFQELINQGFDVSFSSAQDPRLAILAAALEAEQDAEKSRLSTVNEKGEVPASAAQWLQSVAIHARGLLASEADAESLQGAILRLIRKRFSSLILTPVDQIDDDRPLARFGVDSMIAAEFRTWFWTAFKVDVPFLDILSPDKTLSTLAEFAGDSLGNG